MKNRILLLLSVAVIICGSCKNKSVTSIKTENFSTGKAGEMILAIDSIYWTPSAIATIYKVLEQPQPAINQIQPMFDIIQCSNDDFRASFARHRNIVQFDYNKDYSGNSFEIKENPYTNPQIQIVIRGNNCDSCLALFLRHQDEIVWTMYENDIARLQNAHRHLNNAVLEKKIKEKFGITMTIPDSYSIGREEEDFLWLLCRTPKNDRCIMIYKSDAYPLHTDSIIAERNRITKQYIQGAVQGAYPIVAELDGLPLVKNNKIHYHSGVELRGLWASVGDKMGGPFYSFTTLSANGEQCITVDGFVYAPQEKKRDYLREVEAIVKSVN